MDPSPTVYETLAEGSPMHMVPAIRNILGGFLFSGDDIYKRVRVLSGGERTRLAVARMLLRPSNTLLLDEPTNHLDLDSKEVLLDALVAYGGTLIFVSHDRYFVERLATKVIEVGHQTALVYPGSYVEFLWHKERRDRPQGPDEGSRQEARDKRDKRGPGAPPAPKGAAAARVESRIPKEPSREERKRVEAEARRRQRVDQARRARIQELEARISETEQAIRSIESQMAAPGFYEDRDVSQTLIARHQSLMWEVGDLMRQWEELHNSAAVAETSTKP
jgi:ATP-binding cassette subfamily F protein 3